VRLAALLGVGQSLAIGLSVAEAPNEWPWAYAMMIGIHLVLLLTPSAQYAAVDAVRGAAADERARVARRLLMGGGWFTVSSASLPASNPSAMTFLPRGAALSATRVSNSS
jgi:hypothetical protein